MSENTDYWGQDDGIVSVGYINALYQLDESRFAQDLLKHHRFVREYYDPFNTNREVNHNFVRGYHYDGDELKKYRDKRKTPVVFNQVKTSERTILGLWLQNAYSVKFSASSPTDDDISEILEQLNLWEAEQQGDDMNDLELMRQAWAGGNSFQECYMEVKKGKEPQMHTYQQNPFAIYWDPESRDLIRRRDAKFVDRDSWMTYPEITRAWPKQKKKVNHQLANNQKGDGSYEEVTVFADRGHEYLNERNGEFRVTERFYKVWDTAHFAEVDGERIDIDKKDLKKFKMEMPGVQVQTEELEFLNIAIACEDYSSQDYLYNGRYHCQPRDPRTQEIMWPILEMIAESLDGEPQGFVDHERGPNKIVNAMMSHILSSAAHSSAASMLIDPTAFVSDKEARLAARHHSDSDRAFQVKHGRVLDAIKPIEKGGVNQDHLYALDFSLNFLREVTSTPPSLQGQEEKSGVSGVLNAQRIEQGFVQLQPLMKNYILFCKQRAKLRYYYWREYYTFEKTFRVVDKTKPEMNPFITINQMVPETDAIGRFTQGFKKLNNINTAIYDIYLEESVKSATYRNRQLSFIEGLSQSAFAQQDPGLAATLLEEALRLSDAPTETKATLKKHSTLIQQSAIQTKQAEQMLSATQQEGAELDNMAKMQEIAQTEAEQTGLSPTPVPAPATPVGAPGGGGI
jgi:hypothetical protein